MESQQVDPQTQSQPTAPETQQSNSTAQDAPTQNAPSILSSAGISSWAKSLKIPKQSNQDESQPGSSGKSPFARFTSGIGLRLSPRSSQQDENAQGTSVTADTGVFGSLTKGIMDSSRSAVKAVQVKARHIVSQNKRRYQEGGFDLDMTYITENIIAMGFPAGDMSSGFFGYVEGFYRNHMEEVIKFFETHHQGKYKVYNLCSERLYDASLFEGKVASFPFDDHNCPPIHLITLFCQSAYSWLKEDIENVVVVHCKAGMARTGLMISSLLLYLKFFPTAEESIDYYNQKRCIDGKGLVLPSQIRYVKYFERVLTYFNGENLPGRRCMLRGFRLHRCPYWIRPSITVSDHNGILFSSKKHPRTKDLSPEDYWFKAPKKGIMVFALPGEPGLTELAGDFKIHFHDGQGDFYCWLNTTMIENRMTLGTSDMDGFDKRKLPSPGFQVEIVLVDHDGTTAPSTKTPTNSESSSSPTEANSTKETSDAPTQEQTTETTSQDKDDVFSDSDSESSKKKQDKQISDQSAKNSDVKTSEDETSNLAHGVHNVSLKSEEDAKTTKTSEVKSEDRFKSSVATENQEVGSTGMSEFKAMAADASMFSFGDEDDYESE